MIRFSNSSRSTVRKGFTLVELIVVVGIIGVLAGVLLATFSGGRESAQTARCMANMRNLAAACQTYGATARRYPLAGSIEYMGIDESRGISRAKASYHEVPGWISWASMGAYRNPPTSHAASSGWMISMYETDPETSSYALTNGVLWKYVSGSRETYVCPKHGAVSQSGGSGKKGSQMRGSGNLRPNWSYLMNAFFGWDTSEGAMAQGTVINDIDYGHLERADKVLLFGEVPFTGEVGSWQPTGTGPGLDNDCVLQFDTGITLKHGRLGCATGGNGQENIGFNHKSGKMTFANVVFADGHTEKLRLPSSGMGDSELRSLTAWLCTGEDVSFDGRRYTRMEDQ